MSEENKVIDDFTDQDKVVGESNFWDYKANPTLIAVFKGYQKDAYGEHVVVETGGVEIALPNLTALNAKLRKAEIGDKIKVVSLGEQKSKQTGRIYFDFNVFIKPTK
jgi:hypothetical protein